MSDPGDSVAVIDDTSALDTLDPATREIAITQLLDRAKQFMDAAMKQPDSPRLMADFKAQIIAVAEYAKQKRVSEEIQMDATVMVRRSERALGVAIREGQERGEISDRTSGAKFGALKREAQKRGEQVDENVTHLPNAQTYLQAGGEQVHSFAMASADQEQFDAALESAKAERNVSRANVVRKINEANGDPAPNKESIRALSAEGKTSREIADHLGMDKSTVNRALNGRTKQTDHKTARTMAGLADSLWGLRQSLQTITAVDANLDPAQVTTWIRELSSTSTELNRIKNLLKGNS